MRFLILRSVFLLFIVCAGSVSATPLTTAVAEAQRKKLFYHPQWLKLLHYQKRLAGGYQSQIDSAEFFLSQFGRKDPERELEATLGTFFNPEKSAVGMQALQCRFPARRLWLQRELNVEFPQTDCPNFAIFKERLDTHSATLVFSSFYLNNPSSAFGHLLLRLNKSNSAKPEDHYQLLDYGINFAAAVDTTNAFIYGFKGLFGLFKGTYVNVPYYYKVREYNDYEARDLWEYDLNLSPDQIEMLVAHVWELGPAKIPYYYMDGNCATHILTLLDAVSAELNLAERLPPFIVMPTDAIKTVSSTPGLVRSIKYRPSIKTRFDRRTALLNDHERHLLLDVIVSRSLQPLAADQLLPIRARILDAAIDDLDLRYAREFLLEKSGPQDWKQKLLVARATTGILGENLDFANAERSRPDLGHDSRRFRLLGGHAAELGSFGQVDFRMGLHDLLDPSLGYFEDSSIEFLGFSMRYFARDHSIAFENFDFIKILSLANWNAFQHRPAWTIRFGVTRVRDLSCPHCLAATGEGGGGVSFRLLNNASWILYALADFEAAAGNFTDTKGRIGIGPRIGSRVRFADDWTFLTESRYRRYLFTIVPDAAQFDFKLRWSPKHDWGVSVEATRYPRGWEYSGGVQAYF